MNESTDPISLTDFLRARIAEDEARVHAAFSRRRPLDWTDERLAADCEAKRLIVSHMQIVAGIVGPRGEDARAVLTWLALPYADHPDFRRKWRPSVPPIPPPNPHLAATVDGEPPCPL